MNRKKLLLLLRSYYPFILFFLLFIFIFRKVFLQGLVPIPSDLLVTFFFPYKTGGWEGFSPWITHKEFIAADVVRQIYPWRILAMDLWKQGIVPLWNPYAFSGTPLLANIQSAVFYPLNVLFFFLSNKIAWIIYILFQPVLAFSFMYAYIRSLSLSKLAALFSGFAFAFIGYFIVWFELGVVGHTALWLPLVLYGITKYSDKKQQIYLLVSTLGLAISLVGGHAQTAVYIFILSLTYYLFLLLRTLPLKTLLINLWVFILPVGIAAIQLFPSAELLLHSARSDLTSVQVFYRFQLPIEHLAMLFAPDFFGNPASDNFWGKDYNEFLSYVGVVALLFASIGIYHNWKNRIVRFFLTSAILSLLFALPTPLSNLLQVLNIPVLGTSIPSRALFIMEFSLVVLVGYGVATVIDKKRLSYVPILVLSSIYIILWGCVLLLPQLQPNAEILTQLSIAKRNLIFPTLTFIAASGLLLITRFRPGFRFVVIFLCFFIAAFEYQYLLNKYSPFASKQYIFPSHPLLTKLQQISPPNRVYGYGLARLETNLPTEWKLFSPEGYDPLYIRRYGELMYAGEKGKYVKKIPRSDAGFTDTMPNQDSFPKQNLMHLLGVKYVVDYNPIGKETWDPQIERYPTDRFKLIWQDKKLRIYEDVRSLPRATMYYNFQVVEDNEQAVNTVIKRGFLDQHTLLLSEPISMMPQLLATQSAVITSYQANMINISVDTKNDGILLLSDVYYPGWEAFVDGRKVKLLRGDYAFRAVPIMKGKHTIVMQYQPFSFYLGALITGISSLIFLILVLLQLRPVRKKYAKDH